MKKRGYWSTRFGFYLAAVGSACGLGNLWRFPYVVGENGGGAFVLLYIFLALGIGLPLLIGELMLGKFTRKSLIMAADTLGNQVSQSLNSSGPNKQSFKIKSRWIAFSAVFLAIVVLAYYAVVSGWVLYFLTQFIVGQLAFLTGGMGPEMGGNLLRTLMNNGWLQVLLASVHILLCVVVVSKGVHEGLEKWVSYIMPLFGVLMFYLVFQSMSLPSFSRAARFLFYPDFSKLTLASMSQALGHLFFTLSIGFGSMVTFGSYLKEGDHIPTAGFRVVLIDCVLSLMSGLLIFAVVLQNPITMASSLGDPTLLFEALPRFLLQMPGSWFFGILFFLCLYVAALGASIGLLEVVVSNLQDQLQNKMEASIPWDRSRSSWVMGTVVLFIATIPALSSSVFKHVRVGGNGVLELLDTAFINFALPFVVMGVSWIVVKGLRHETKENLFVDSNKVESVVMFSHWKKMLTLGAPLVITISLFLQLIYWLLG
jgi:NSS family neurotransmitter:Na+ symporter